MRFFYYALDATRARQRQRTSTAAVVAGRNRLGKFPATVIQTRVARRRTVSAAAPLQRDVNVCISIILQSDECREPTTLTVRPYLSLLASKAPTVFFFCEFR